MKTVVEMAREAGLAPICKGCDVTDVSYAYESWDVELKAFAELVRADAIAEERKACAKECKFGRSSADIEQAIRARGETSIRSNT